MNLIAKSHIVLFMATAICANAQQTSVRAVGQPTAVPIVLSQGIDAAHVHVGDLVTAKTMQKVVLPDRTELPKGTIVEGRITSAQPSSFDAAPYATQRPSVLGLRFDQIKTSNGVMRIVASVRALADSGDSREAMRPQPLDEHDIVGTVSLIGGGSYRGDARSVINQDGDVIAYVRRDGVFARLFDSQAVSRFSHVDCPGSGATEESVAIFSPSACGVYGLRDLYLVDNGLDGDPGTFRLESRGHTVKLAARSTALIEVVEAR